MWAKFFSFEHVWPFRGSSKAKKSRNISNTETNTLLLVCKNCKVQNKTHQKFFQKQVHNVKSRPFKCTRPRKGAKTFQHRLYEKHIFVRCPFLFVFGAFTAQKRAPAKIVLYTTCVGLQVGNFRCKLGRAHLKPLVARNCINIITVRTCLDYCWGTATELNTVGQKLGCNIPAF